MPVLYETGVRPAIIVTLTPISDPNLKQVKIEEPVPAAYQNQYLHTARFPQ